MIDLGYFKKQLKKYRDLLANFSRKNRELYFRESRGSSINLTKIPFKQSELKEKQDLHFNSFRINSAPYKELFSEEGLDLHEHFLLDDIKNEKLAKRLDKSRLADESHQREYGISGAWLLGPFICLRPPQASPENLIIAPVLKMPVDFHKSKAKKISVFLENDEIHLNPSLVLFLKNQFSVEVSEDTAFETTEEAIEYLKNELSMLEITLLRDDSGIDTVPKIPPRFKNIKDENGNIIEKSPTVLAEELTSQEIEIYNKVTAKEFLLLDVFYIDQLNASRSILISDYDEILAAGNEEHPLLSLLFNGQYHPKKESDPEKFRQLDKYSEKENHFVIDIDSTQHRALDSANKGNVLVIQGPPGTGKSQTITNLIADNLAKGKRVLFVSEKRPALDVVFNRLKQAEIASQAVLIHSSDLNKSDLYKSFLELSDLKPKAANEKKWNVAVANLDNVKASLNKYADALTSEHQLSGLVVSDLIAETAGADRELFDLDVYEWVKHVAFENIELLARDLDDLRASITTVSCYESHPWRYRNKELHYTQALRQELKNFVEKFQREVCRLVQLRNELAVEVKDPHNQAQIKAVSERISELLQLDLGAAGWKSYYSILASKKPLETKSVSKRIAELHGVMNKHFEIQIGIKQDSNLSIIERLENYYKLPRTVMDWFTPTFWSHRKLRQQHCNNWSGTSREFESFRELRNAFTEFVASFKDYALDETPLITDKASIDASLTSATLTLSKLQQYLDRRNDLPAVLIDPEIYDDTAREKYCEHLKDVYVKMREMLDLHEKLSVEWASLSRYLTTVPKLKSGDEMTALKFVSSLLITVEDLDQLERVDNKFLNIESTYAMKSTYDFFFKKLWANQASLSKLLFSSAILGWKDEVSGQLPVLRSFEHNTWGDIIGTLRDNLKEHQEAARQAVQQKFAKRWTGEDRNDSGLWLLNREATKKRKVLSPREIMEKGALDTMMQLKPCWLMSPLSISQLLPLTFGLFDVIIFDEASQVRVEDAIPAIVRAKTMVVVGDPQQMPPTNFFAATIADDNDEDDEFEIANSILDLAAQSCPSVMLEWHYRSKCESLIAFSNRAFYGGKLIAPPNPYIVTETTALTFEMVNEACYDSKLGNLFEAEKTVLKLKEILLQHPYKSCGIIALGQTQVNALEDALDKLMMSDESFRNLVDRARNFKQNDADAGLFIKNLENVQGDERDIIILAVGYARSKPGKKVYLNFGPLSKQGGGRRLNVAVTRARERMHVITSFDPSEIPSDGEHFAKNPDLATFGRYLKYAKAISEKKIDEVTRVLDSFGISGVIARRKPSRFSIDVKRELEALGHQVSLEIGSSGFYIDIGVHHPNIPGNFLLGIECDGGIWHSHPYARDRDDIREGLLLKRGWRIERVGSQAWSKNRKDEILRLDSKIKELLAYRDGRGYSDPSEQKRAVGHK